MSSAPEAPETERWPAHQRRGRADRRALLESGARGAHRPEPGPRQSSPLSDGRAGFDQWPWQSPRSGSVSLPRPTLAECAIPRASWSRLRLEVAHYRSRGPKTLPKRILLLFSLSARTDVKSFAELRQVPPRNNSGTLVVGVDHGFDARRWAATVKITDRLNAVNQGTGGD